MVEDITVEQFVALLAKGDITPVDVRSPGEFAEGTVPGSVNVPLFDDRERRDIGINYKQISVDAAKELGLEIVAGKLPEFIRKMQSLPGRKAVFCWRGGMRSKASATLLSLVAGKVYRVQGGIRAYRRWVVETLAGFEWKPPLVVLGGYTGTGKTEALRRLQRKGYPALDLEGLAGHRGSIFGGVGTSPRNQRTFEALLVHELIRLNHSPYVLMEAESRRVGKVMMPEFLVAAKERAIQLYLEMPVEERIRNILEDYEPEKHPQECLDAFARIERKIHTPVAREIRRAMENGEYADAVRGLLEYYYDPRYEHTVSEYNAERITLRVRNTEDAIERIEAYIKQAYPHARSG